jgi:hypothetical protein
MKCCDWSSDVCSSDLEKMGGAQQEKKALEILGELEKKL